MTSPELKITKAGQADMEQLRNICIHTFSETYEHLNSSENFEKYIERSFNPAQLSKELSDENSFTYIFFIKEEAIGYLKLNVLDSQTENIKGNGMEVERIYVLKKFQGMRLGTSILTFAIDKARELNHEFIWLGVWEKNNKAVLFYEKHGFKRFDTHLFILGDDAQTDYLYKRTL